MQISIRYIKVRKDRPENWEVHYYVDGRRQRKSYRRLDYETRREVKQRLLEELKEEAARVEAGVPKDKTVGKIVEEFFLAVSSSLRSTTVLNYRLHLNKLDKAYGHLSFSTLVLSDLESWMAAYEKTNVSPATVNQAIRSFRRLWSWSVDHDYAPKNIAKKLHFRRVPEKLGVALTEEEIPKFLAACPPAFRPIAIVALFAGLRKQEVVNLKWNAVSFEQNVIEVRNDGDFRTKSGKHRVIPMHPVLKETLSGLNQKTEYVFADEQGKKRSGKSSYFLLRTIAAAKKAGITRPVCFHALRHTFATRLSLYGLDMEATRLILGHADVQTTRIYVHPTLQLVQAMGKVPGLPKEPEQPTEAAVSEASSVRDLHQIYTRAEKGVA